MKLLSIDRVRMGPSAIVYRESQSESIKSSVGFVALAGAYFWRSTLGVDHPAAPRLVGGIMLLVAVFVARHFWRGRSPENWVFAVDGSRLLLKLRSYRLTRPGGSPPLVVELPLDEVLSVRGLTKELTMRRRHLREESRFLEISVEARVDLAPLVSALRAEFHHFPCNDAVWHDRRITMPTPSTVRIEWRNNTPLAPGLAPGLDAALTRLGTEALRLPDRTERFDFSRVDTSIARGVAERELLALAGEGRVQTAVRFARRAFGWSRYQSEQFLKAGRDDPRAVWAVGAVDRNGLSSGVGRGAGQGREDEDDFRRTEHLDR